MSLTAWLGHQFLLKHAEELLLQSEHFHRSLVNNLLIIFSVVKVKFSMARSLPGKNLLPQKVGSIINYLQ